MATFLPEVPTTELEAVNTMLAAAGEASVSTISGVTTPDVGEAINTLGRINREVQSKGWYFNSDYDVTLSLNSDSNIVVGNNILSVKVPGRDIVLRGRKLYDREFRRFTFTAAITTARTITLLNFEDLPETARRYIAMKAARIYQSEDEGDSTAETVNQREEWIAKAAMEDEDAEVGNYNVGWDTVDMFNTLKRDRLYNGF